MENIMNVYQQLFLGILIFFLLAGIAALTGIMLHCGK
jgi:hypothetical protein